MERLKPILFLVVLAGFIYCMVISASCAAPDGPYTESKGSIKDFRVLGTKQICGHGRCVTIFHVSCETYEYLINSAGGMERIR